eukprot:5651118-Pyramimonas_sp.AAC.1
MQCSSGRTGEHRPKREDLRWPPPAGASGAVSGARDAPGREAQCRSKNSARSGPNFGLFFLC